MKQLCILFFTLWTFTSNATEFKGIILNKNTDESIPFASIFIKGTTNGTVSNNEGEFIIREDSNEITIICTIIGYKPDSFKLIKSVPYYKLYLMPIPVELEQITITPESYPRTLIQKAIQKIKSSPNPSVYSESFYRQITKIHNVPSEFQEILYKSKSNNYRINETSIEQGRYAVKNEDKFRYKNAFYFTNNLIWNKIESEYEIILSNSDRLKFELLGFVNDNFEKIAEIKVSTKNPKINFDKGYIIYFVNVENLSIREYKGESYKPFQNTTNLLVKIKNQKLFFDIHYQGFHNDLQIIKSISMKSTFSLKYQFLKQDSIEIISNAMFWNHDLTQPNCIFRIPIEKDDRDMIDQVNYKPSFWERELIFKPTKEEQELINTFNKTNSFGKISID